MKKVYRDPACLSDHLCSVKLEIEFRAVDRAPDTNVSQREHVSPFGRSLFRNVFSGFDKAVHQMEERMHKLSDDPDAHCYTHSSYSSYTAGEDGEPKYFEATNSERKAPGGVRETRKTVRDSEKDLAKMAVGHHIGNRGHVIEKIRNTETGHEEEKQDFIGIERDQASAFDKEWRGKMSAFRHDVIGDAQNQRSKDRHAIEDMRREEKHA